MNKDVKAAQEEYNLDKDYWNENYKCAREDNYFLSDADDAQWDGSLLTTRRKKGRPALTIDQLGQFVHQVANDIRQNTPSINVIPSHSGNQETADVLKGLIKDIEYRSNADNAYDMGALNAIKGGIGFIRVDHDYEYEEGLEQRLEIKRVVNPLACFMDRNSTEPDGSDAKRATIIETLSVKEFKRRYPKKEAVSFGETESRDLKDEDDVNIAEVFTVLEEEQPIEDGQRVVLKRTIKREIMSGKEVLEEGVFPGKYIPLVPVYGEEHWVNGKRKLYSLIRKSKDAQRQFNYWKSLETELLMKAPKAPWKAPIGSVEAYADAYANPDEAMVLPYDMYDEDGRRLDPPQREAMPPIPTGVVNAARAAVDDIKGTMGIYNAALGQVSNETSGVAINQRKLEGDVATYHFSDNLVKSITQVGRILVCAIPEIYDTERIVRIIGEEEESKQVGINGYVLEDQEEDYDLRKGQYDVRVITGASFTTRRQEMMQAMNELFRGNPEMFARMADIYFQNSDFAGAQALADRAKKLLPPELREDEEGQDPQLAQAAQMIKTLQMQNQQLEQKLDDKTQSEQQKYQLEVAKLRAEISQESTDDQLEAEKLKLEREKLELEKLRLQIELRAVNTPPEINQGIPA